MAITISRTIFTTLLALLSVMSPIARNAAASQPMADSRLAAGPGWSTPQKVSTSSDVDSGAPTLAVTTEGTVHVVWEEGDQLHHSYKTGAAWSTPAQISGTGNAQQPALAAGLLDEVHLAYAKQTNTQFNIYRVSWNGSTWSLPRNVSQHEVGTSTSPDIAVAPDGSVHIVAVELTSQRLYHADVAQQSYLPVPNAGFAASPSLAASSTTGILQIVYRNTVDSNIYAMRRAGGTWSLPEAVSVTAGQPSTGPKVALDIHDGIHVAWRETIMDTPQVQYAQGPSWTEVITLSQSASGTGLPGFALDAMGGRHAAWGDGSPPSFALRHTYSSAEGLWSTPEVVQSASASLSDVVLFGSANGLIHAVWVEGATGEVWYASLAPQRVFVPLVLRH